MFSADRKKQRDGMPLVPNPVILAHQEEVDFYLSGLSTPYGLAPNQVRWK